MEDMDRGSRGLSNTKHSPPKLSVATEAEERTGWWQTQNIPRDGTSGCKIVLNGQMFFTLPSRYQHRIRVGACSQ